MKVEGVHDVYGKIWFTDACFTLQKRSQSKNTVFVIFESDHILHEVSGHLCKFFDSKKERVNFKDVVNGRIRNWGFNDLHYSI